MASVFGCLVLQILAGESIGMTASCLHNVGQQSWRKVWSLSWSCGTIWLLMSIVSGSYHPHMHVQQIKNHQNLCDGQASCGCYLASNVWDAGVFTTDQRGLCGIQFYARVSGGCQEFSSRLGACTVLPLCSLSCVEFYWSQEDFDAWLSFWRYI